MTFLFTQLQKYQNTEDSTPAENFVTEAFCFLLRKSPAVARWLLCEAGIAEPGALEEVLWETQVRVSEGILDLRATGESFVVVFEHKVSGEVGEEQLARYSRHVNGDTYECDFRFLCAITPQRMKQETCKQFGMNALTWSEVCEAIDRLQGVDAGGELEQFLAREFMNLMEEMGMGKLAPANVDALRQYYQSSALRGSLISLLSQVRANFDWTPYFQKLPRLDEEKRNTPRSVRYRWGRVGIDLGDPWDGDWLPSLGFTVMLDTEDHAYQPKDPSLGPDLCLVVDIDRPYGKTLLEGKPNHALYKKLVKEFEKIAQKMGNGWECYDHIGTLGKRGNAFHPLYLRKPLCQVLEGKRTADEQRRAMEAELKLLLDKILGVNGVCMAPTLFEMRKLFQKLSMKKAA